jgi:hypothetical protein
MPQKLLLLGMKAHAVSRQAIAGARACSIRAQQQWTSCRLSQQRQLPPAGVGQLGRGRRRCATSAPAAALLLVLLLSGLQQRLLRWMEGQGACGVILAQQRTPAAARHRLGRRQAG